MGYKFIKLVTETQMQNSIEGAKEDLYRESVSSAIADEKFERVFCDTAIVESFTEADNNIQSSLAAESVTRRNNDDAIRSDFQAADGDIIASLAAETSARRTADDSIKSDFDTKLGLQAVQLSNLGNSLDSVSNSVDTLSGGLDNETSNRTEQFRTVGDAINAEANTRANADVTLSSAISAINERLNRDSTISSALSTETSTRQNQTSSLSSALSAETSARRSADDSLSAAISSETSIRRTADDSLKSIFDSAVADYKQADTTLKSFVDGAIINLLSSDTKIQTALNNEVTLRANQTASLSSALTNEVNLQAQHFTALSNGLAAINTALDAEKITRGNTDADLRASIESAIQNFNNAFKVFKSSTTTAAGEAGIVPAPPVLEDSDTVYYLTNKGWGEPLETRIKIGSTPAQIDPPRFTGNVIIAQFSDFNTDALSISSETRATNAGTYTAVFTPREGYMWADGTQDPRRVTWRILPAVVSVPTAEVTSFEYTGSAITLSVSNFDSNGSSQTGVVTATNKGDYTAKYELKNTQNYIFADNTTAAKTIAWHITVKSIAKPTISNTTFTFDGNNHAPTISGYLANYMSQTGVTSSTNAGNFTVTYTLKDTGNTQWVGGGTSAVNLSWVINRAKLTAAQSTGFAQSGTLIVTGLLWAYPTHPIAQSVTITNYDSSLHKLAGVTSAQEAGTYTAQVLPDDNHCWSDGTTTAKNVSWTIDKRVLKKPTMPTTSFDYTGSVIRPAINDFQETNISAYTTQSEAYFVVTGTRQSKDVGNFSITFSLRRAGIDTIWEDGTTTDVTLNWAVVKGAGFAKPTLSSTSFEWTGGNISPTINNFYSSSMNKVGTDTAVAISNYSITISLKDKTNTSWADGTTADVTLNWSITKRTLTKPTLTNASQDYSGSAKSPTLNNFNSTYMNKSGTESEINAGSYSITCSLKNTTTCQWAGGGTSNVVLNWTINRQKLTAALSTFGQSGSITYNGNSQSVTISGYNSTYHDLSSTTSAVNAGTYTAKIAPKANYAFSDGSTAAKSVNWSVGKMTLTKPTLTNATYTYDGNNHSPTINNFNSTYENQAGTTNTKTAGTYTVTWSLKDTNNTQWSGNTTANVTADWKINKATPTLTLDKTSVTLDNDTPFDNIAITYDGDGDITVSTANLAIAAITYYSPSAGAWTGDNATSLTISNSDFKQRNLFRITVYVYKNTTVTVTAAAGTNYNAAGNKTVSVTGQYIQALRYCDWDEIKAIIAAGKATEKWRVGDLTKEFSVTYKGNTHEHLRAYILGFNHNSTYEANGYSNYVDFIIGIGSYSGWLSDQYYNETTQTPVTQSGYFTMTTSSTFSTSFNYQNSNMASTCSSFRNAMPSEIKNVMIPAKKYATRGNNASVEYDCGTHYMWIPDLNETGYLATKIQMYDLFKNGNQYPTAGYCWTRSITNHGHVLSLVNGWRDTFPDGSSVYLKGNFSFGFSPCFRIGA